MRALFFPPVIEGAERGGQAARDTIFPSYICMMRRRGGFGRV